MKFIDTHCHVFPHHKFLTSNKIIETKKKLPFEDWIKGKIDRFSNIVHKAQTNLPDNQWVDKYKLKDKLLEFGSLGTIIQHDHIDLLENLKRNKVDKCLLIAHPPLLSNELVMALSIKYKEFYPVVNISEHGPDVKKELKYYISQGAVALKIHAAADGLSEKNEHYKKLLTVANQKSLPVIIHTGALEVPFYKVPHYGDAEIFEEWFSSYKNIKFILAHMNIYKPQIVIDFCKKYENVYTDISWQSESSILHAIDELAGKKIMFGTDWPFVGNNTEVMRKRLVNLFETNKISSEIFHNIARKTAEEVFKLS